MEKYLFTIFCEYKKGTFVSQVESDTPENAIEKWIKSLDYTVMKIPEKKKTEVETNVLKEKLSPLKDLRKIWCISPELNKRMAIIHIIKCCNLPVN